MQHIPDDNINQRVDQLNHMDEDVDDINDSLDDIDGENNADTDYASSDGYADTDYASRDGYDMVGLVQLDLNVILAKFLFVFNSNQSRQKWFTVIEKFRIIVQWLFSTIMFTIYFSLNLAYTSD